MSEDDRSLERPDTPLGQSLVFETLMLGVEYIYASAVPGHIAEFGTMSGATATTIGRAMRDGDQRYRLSEQMHGIDERSLYLFDSFQGFPKTNNPIDAASPHVATDVWGPGVARGLTAPELHSACAEIFGPDRVKVTPGWFNETLPGFRSDLRFALVSIDCDLYESTASVLEYLLGKQTYSDGCAVFFDDWYCNRGSPEFGEQKAWAEYTQPVQDPLHRLGALFCGRTQIHPPPLRRHDFRA